MKNEFKYLWLMAGIFFLMLYLATPYSIFGASFDHKIIVSDDPSWDSSYVVIYRGGVHQSTETVLADTTLSLDNLYSWAIYKMDFWYGLGYFYPDPPTIYQVSISSVGGTGSDTLLYYAADTSNGILVAGVNITGRYIGGSSIGTQLTNSSGLTVWTLLAGDTIIFTAGMFGSYLWEVDTAVAPTNGGADSLFGYPQTVTVSPPSDTSLCNVWGYVYDLQHQPDKFKSLTFFPENDDVFNTCDSTMTKFGSYKTRTLATGYFIIPLLKSSCIEDSEWTVEMKDGRKHTFSIPADSSTYRLVF